MSFKRCSQKHSGKLLVLILCCANSWAESQGRQVESNQGTYYNQHHHYCVTGQKSCITEAKQTKMERHGRYVGDMQWETCREYLKGISHQKQVHLLGRLKQMVQSEAALYGPIIGLALWHRFPGCSIPPSQQHAIIASTCRRVVSA